MLWNGTNITGVPTLIYHDELYPNDREYDPNGPGSLTCRVEGPLVRWFMTDGNFPGNDFTTIRRNTQNLSWARLARVPSLLTAVEAAENPIYNGLMICRDNSDTRNTHYHVGLYARDPGKIRV